MRPPITVAVVGGDRLFSEALAAMLHGFGLRVVDLRGGREKALEAGEAREIDIVLIDAQLDGEAALALVKEIGERWREARIIVHGLHREDESVVDFVEAGALGYALSGTSPDELYELILAVHEGRTVCSPRVMTSVVERISQLARDETWPPSPPAEPLTPREREILGLMARGLGNKEIGRFLRVTVQTVKNHVHNILAKLGVHRRRDAVRLGYELGLLDDPRDEGLDLF